jgi:DNA-binding MarR family transcriptional regulator
MGIRLLLLRFIHADKLESRMVDSAADIATTAYVLDDQVGFVLRQVSQRHATIFASRMIEGLTPTQWAVLIKLAEKGPLSQNLLGRHTAMDAATVKGVVDRLAARNFVTGEPDPQDARRLIIGLTAKGEALARRAIPLAKAITEETLAPLAGTERRTLIKLLQKLR